MAYMFHLFYTVNSISAVTWLLYLFHISLCIVPCIVRTMWYIMNVCFSHFFKIIASAAIQITIYRIWAITEEHVKDFLFSLFGHITVRKINGPVKLFNSNSPLCIMEHIVIIIKTKITEKIPNNIHPRTLTSLRKTSLPVSPIRNLLMSDHHSL